MKHGRTAYVHGTCKCDVCRTANNAYQRQQTAVRKARLAADPTLAAHGTVATYCNWGCRCVPCTAAQLVALADQKASRRARAEADPAVIPHGTNSGYCSWACRCVPCTGAAAEYKRTWLASRTEVAS